MLLLPLQPLSGDSVVEPSVSAGAFSSGNGFQEVLQDAQHQLAMASSDPPDESAPPSLASLVSEALTDALTPEEGAAKGSQTPVITQGKTPSPMLVASDDVSAEMPEGVFPVGEISDDAQESPTFRPLQELDVESEGHITNGKQVPLSQNLPGKTGPQYPVTAQPASLQQTNGAPEQIIVPQPVKPSVESSVTQQMQQPDFESMPEPQRQHIPTPLRAVSQEETVPLAPEDSEAQRPVLEEPVLSQPQKQWVDQGHELPITQNARQPVIPGEVQRRVMPAQNVYDQDMGVQDHGDGHVEVVQPGKQVETLSAPWPVQSNHMIQPETRVVSNLNAQDDRVKNQVLETETSELPLVNREASVVNREIPITNRPEVMSGSSVVSEQPVVSDQPVITDQPVEETSELPLVNREAPVVNRETPIVNRPEVMSGSGVVSQQAQLSDQPVEETSELPLVNREAPVVNRETPIVNRPEVMSGSGVVSQQAQLSEQPVEEGSALPLVNREAPVVNRETPIVNRPEVMSGSGVVSQQAQLSEQPVEEGSALPLENRETPIVNRETPIVNRPEVMSGSGIVSQQAQLSEQPVEEGSALPLVNREASVVNRETPIVNRPEVMSGSGVVSQQAQLSEQPVEEGSALPLVNREAPVVNRETPIVNRPDVTPGSRMVGDQTPVGGRVAEQNPSVVSNTEQSNASSQPATRAAGESQAQSPGVTPQNVNREVAQPNQASVRTSDHQTAVLRETASAQSQQNIAPKPQSEPQVVKQDVPPVTTGAAPALAAETDRPRVQTVAAPVDAETQVVDGAEYKISSSSTSSQEQAFTANDENASQQPVVSRAPVERTSNQPSFVIPEADVVQVPEQPAQMTDAQSSELDVEIGSIERPTSRVDVTAGASRSSQDATSQVDLEASAEEIDRLHRVSQQIIRSARVMTRDGATQVTMRLDPPELGEVSIQISSSQTGVVSGEIAVESQKVQEIVQRNMGALREALSEQGIQIDQIDVSVDDRSGSNATDRESFRETLEERSNNARSNTDQQQEQSQQESPEEEPSQGSNADGGVNFVA